MCDPVLLLEQNRRFISWRIQSTWS